MKYVVRPMAQRFVVTSGATDRVNSTQTLRLDRNVRNRLTAIRGENPSNGDVVVHLGLMRLYAVRGGISGLQQDAPTGLRFGVTS